MTLFYVGLRWGCGLIAARTLASARKQALIENGTHNLVTVRPATDEDVSWIRAMGGCVPEGRVRAERNN